MIPVEPQQELVYAAPAEPQRINISPEMFQKLMAGHPVTEDEIHSDARAIGGAVLGDPAAAVQSVVAPVTEAASSAVDAAADAVAGKKKSKKEKKSKDGSEKKSKDGSKKVKTKSGKKKGCC